MQSAYQSALPVHVAKGYQNLLALELRVLRGGATCNAMNYRVGATCNAKNYMNSLEFWGRFGNGLGIHLVS